VLNVIGIPEKGDLDKITPSQERLAHGPVVVVECFQPIPCDPCCNICSKGAIQKKDNTVIPVVDHDKCNGCGRCVSACPGLAIFVVNLSEEHALVMLPYEFYPFPKAGELVVTLNRAGEAVGQGQVVRVQNNSLQRQTRVITIKVPAEQVMEIRNIKSISSLA